MEDTATMTEVMRILTILPWMMQSMAATVVALVNAYITMDMVFIFYSKNHQHAILLT